MVSPQETLSNVCWRLSPARTIHVLPPEGVSFNALRTYSLGSSAGPSKFLPLAVGERSCVAPRSEKGMIRKSEITVAAAECWLEPFMLSTPFHDGLTSRV